MRILGSLIALFVLVIASIAGCGHHDRPQTLHFDGDDRLLVDEHSGPRDGWEITSGSLFVFHGWGWTGEPDRGKPDGNPHGTTNSSVFRLRSTARDLDDVAVSMRFRVASYRRDAAHDYDGVHIWLRYQSPDDLYALSVMRHDGTTVIKRKTSDGYRVLAQGRGVPSDAGWHTARAVATDVDGGVRLQAWVDGRIVLDAVDRSHPLGPGRVGVRTDEANVYFDDLTVVTVP